MRTQLSRWLQPAPGSLAAQDACSGQPTWTHFVHLVWSVWVFLTPAFSGGAYGFTPRWCLLTLLSYPLFLWLYTVSVMASPRRAQAAALAMVALCFALLPWYPSGLSYFVFGCVMLQPRRKRSLLAYFLALAVLNAALLGYARWIGYPWQALVWMPTVTMIIGALVAMERMNRVHAATLKLSQEEVRRLAALAERERIGRDLHDLLGHTLRAVSGIRAAGIAAELASAKLLLETDGVTFDYHLDEAFSENAMPPGVESALAMTVREAATNIQRHARAARAEVRFGLERNEAVLHVVDDGRGGAIVPGNGLSGMRERIEAVRGRMRVESGKGGTRIEVRIPLAANDDDAS